MSIPVIDTLYALGNFPVVKSDDVDVNGTNLTTVINQKANNETMVSSLSGKVDKVEGKVLSSNDYSNSDKSKLSRIEEGANRTYVDASLNATSTNAIQNKAVSVALSEKASAIDLSNIANRVSENEINISTQTARIDVIESLPEGSTISDARLEDICVKADGETSETPGNAVREQIVSVNNRIDKLSNSVSTGYKNLLDVNGISLDKTRANGSAYDARTLNDGEGWFVSDLFEIEPNTEYCIYFCHNDYVYPYTISQLSGAFVGADYHPISSFSTVSEKPMSTGKSPANAKYLYVQGKYWQTIIGTDVPVYEKMMVVKKGLAPKRYFEYGKEIHDFDNYNPAYKLIESKMNNTTEEGWYYPIKSDNYKLINAKISDDGFFKTVSYGPEQAVARIFISLNCHIPYSAISGITLVMEHDMTEENSQFGISEKNINEITIPTYDYKTTTKFSPFGVNFHTVPKSSLNNAYPATICITLSGSHHLKINGVLVNHKTEPTILLNFDQIWQESIDNGSYDFLHNNGVPYTLFATSEGYTGFTAQSLEMIKNGNELSLYGGIPNVTNYSTIDTRIKETISGCCANEGVTSVSWGTSQHNGNFTQVKALINNNIKLIRNQSSSTYINNLNNQTNVINTFDVGGYTLDQLKTIVDTVSSGGYIASVFTHGVCAEGNSYMTVDGVLSQSSGVGIDTFKAFIAYAKLKGVKFRTFKSFVDNEIR